MYDVSIDGCVKSSGTWPLSAPLLIQVLAKRPEAGPPRAQANPNR